MSCAGNRTILNLGLVVRSSSSQSVQLRASCSFHTAHSNAPVRIHRRPNLGHAHLRLTDCRAS